VGTGAVGAANLAGSSDPGDFLALMSRVAAADASRMQASRKFRHSVETHNKVYVCRHALFAGSQVLSWLCLTHCVGDSVFVAQCLCLAEGCTHCIWPLSASA
jgi:hypothetical protein